MSVPFSVKWVGGGSYEIASIIHADYRNSPSNPNYWGHGTPGIKAPPTVDERKAYAKLFEAAPDLLAQLEFAVKLLRALPVTANTAQIDAMRAAIAKARGQ